MRRKLIKQKSAYTVTLPINWVREHHLDAKEELEFTIDHDRLIIAAAKQPSKKEVSLQLETSTPEYYRIMIENHYLKGYDVLKLSFPENAFSYLQKIVANLVGFEIIEQKKNSCVISATANPDRSEFKTLLQRMINIISYTQQLIKEDIEKGILENESVIASQTKDVRRFMLFCTRLLHKESIVPREEESFVHLLLERLILLQNNFYYLYKKLPSGKISFKKEVQDVFFEVCSMYDLFKKMFLKKDLSFIATIHEQWEELYFSKGPKLMANKSKEESILLYHSLHIAKLLFLLAQPSLVQPKFT